MDISKDELLRVIDEVRQDVCDKEFKTLTYECHNGDRFSNNYEVNENGSPRFKFEITTKKQLK